MTYENLDKLKQDLVIYINLHSQKSKMYNYIYNSIMYSSIIIGIIIGLLVSTTSIDMEHVVYKIVVTICSFLNSLFIAIIKFKNFEEISITHKKATKEYLSLHRAISQQLRSKNEDFTVFNAWAFQKYDTIFQSTPFVIDKKMYSELNRCINDITIEITDENRINKNINNIENIEEEKVEKEVEEEEEINHEPINISSTSSHMMQYELRRLRSNM